VTAAEQDTAPIFIVGARRSGTTMMRLILNNHGRIGIPNESWYFPEIYEPYSQAPSKWQAAVDQFAGLCERRFEPAVDLNSVRERLRAVPAPDYSLLLALSIGTWAAAEGKTRWGEKTPFHIFYAEAMMRLFPSARVIIMVRDPRATVSSMNRFRPLGSGTALNARLWRDTYTRGTARVERWVPRSQRLAVRYEALTSEPERVVREICDFLGEDFTPALLEFYKSTARYQATFSRSTPKVEEPIAGDEQSWRETLSTGDLAVIESICGPTMEALGYAKLGRPLRVRERAHIAASRGYVAAKQLQHRRLAYHPVTYRPFARFRQSG
jgi:hypothetical protein